MSSVLDAPIHRLVTLPEGVPALTLGFEAARWISKYLRQPNGPRSGQRVQLTRSQLRFLLHFYAVDADGRWLYRRAVRRLAKGSGKSPFAAMLALVELCAPVRFDRFDPAADGGCVGKPVSLPWVVIAATTQDQTENTMRMVRAYAPKGSRVANDHGLDTGLTQYNKRGGGKLQILTSSSASAEGGEFTFAVGDEPEHWVPAQGGPDFASTLADNLAKSGSRMVETCNSWKPGAGSVAESSWDAWVAQEEGRTRGDSKILYDARVAPPDTDLADAESLIAALEFVYDDCWWADLQSVRERIWDPQSLPADSRRKYLNQPTADESSWTTPQLWALCSDPTKIVADGDRVALFFDGSKSRDATALVGCRISDGHVFTLGVWEPAGKHASGQVDEVDVAAVDLAVERAFGKYRVAGFFADVREWESFAKVSWPDRFGAKLAVNAVPGGKDPQPIAWDMRTHVYEFGVACELTRAEIADRSFTHDGDSRLARHVGNAKTRTTRGVETIGKESADSSRKIDAAVCMIGARMVRRLVIASGPVSPGRGRVIALA